MAIEPPKSTDETPIRAGESPQERDPDQPLDQNPTAWAEPLVVDRLLEEVDTPYDEERDLDADDHLLERRLAGFRWNGRPNEVSRRWSHSRSGQFRVKPSDLFFKRSDPRRERRGPVFIPRVVRGVDH